MFGFCWLNFYGFLREFFEFLDEYDDFNFGKVSIWFMRIYLLFSLENILIVLGVSLLYKFLFLLKLGC